MNDTEIRALTIESLDRIERRLHDIAVRNRLNAVLWMAEPSLVLPSPAVGLLAVRCEGTMRLHPELVLRSVEPVGPDGDVTLTAACEGFIAHPWQIDSASWVGAKCSCGFEARALDVRLFRVPGSTAHPGWLSLGFQSNSWLTWGIARARVTCGEARLETRPFGLPVSPTRSAPWLPGPVHFHLEAVTSTLRMVELTAAEASSAELALRFHFDSPIPFDLEPSPPMVHVNAVPVWNSRACVYPGQDQVEQATSETQGRRLHVLSPRALGPHWRAWSVDGVGAAGDARIRFTSSPGGVEGSGYHLGLMPAEARQAPSIIERFLAAELALILDERARRRLDEARQHLRINYRATLGDRANGIGGTEDGPLEFELEDRFSTSVTFRLTGELVGTLWGGSAGWIGNAGAVAAEESLEALLVGAGARSVGDVAAVLRSAYGSELEIVDEGDLLRHANGAKASPLAIRIRFLRRDREPVERRSVLRSCRHFLGRYLANTPHGGFDLVDADEGGSSHAS